MRERSKGALRKTRAKRAVSFFEEDEDGVVVGGFRFSAWCEA